jgi:hypothetical protein
MTVQNNIAFMFNRIYLNLMKEIKNKDVDIKAKLKQTYKVFDKKSDEYITRLSLSMDDRITCALFGNDDIIDNVEILNFEIFVGVTVCEVMKKVVEDNDESKNSFKYYMYILMVFTYMFKLDDMDDDKKTILLQKTVHIINSVDTKTIKDDSELETHMEDILDDDIRKLLVKMYNDRVHVKENVMKMDTDDLGSGMEFLNNTKIGELAKEISNSIDMEKLNMSNPEDLMNMGNLFSGSNNMLGDIIQTVGTKITQKIQNGEINQEELMSEALGMMGSLNTAGHGDMMSQMMSMMGGMGGMSQMMGAMGGMGGMGGMSDPGDGSANPSANPSGNKTRDRLQKKLANKKI